MTRNNFIFGGVNSADYNVWISGSGSFSAPERRVERVSVPGRNGDLIIDGGKWNNITVTYPAFIPKGFETQFDYFRSEMSKLTGYQRLEDSYHPDEYRMAALADGIAPSRTGAFLKNGEFSLTFNCKPQRFLKSGETANLNLASTGSAQYLVAEGIGDDIFSAAFKNNHSIDYSISYTIVSLAAIHITADTFVKLWYSDDIIGKHYVCGKSSPDPTQGWTGSSTLQHFWSDTYYEYEVGNGLGENNYAWFPTPLRWELWDGDTLVDAEFPDSGSVYNPTGFRTKPMIHITMSSECDGKVVALINDMPIRITSPEDNLLPDTGGIEMTDVYIDCETQNAYMPKDTAYINLNQYVSLPELPIELSEGESQTFINSSIDGIEIIPRWWRL